MTKLNHILVTGGAGYIGSICTELLIKQGYKVVVLDNLATGHRVSVHPKAIFVKGNIGNSSLLGTLFDKYSIDCVIHFAAETLVDKANTAPQDYYFNNIAQGLKMLNTMVKKGVKNIIYSSSAAVYGNPEKLPISEDHPKNPLNAYGDTKLFFETMLKRYSVSFGLKYIIFRYFNPAGASKNYGEEHDPETHLIPLVLQVAQGKRKFINIFGSDWQTKDGTCVRDYIHVVDVAEAHILALKKLPSLSGSIFNLGSEEGFTVKEVIETARKVTGKKISVRIKERRKGDPEKLIASSLKARKVLGWQPKTSTLEEIISSAWALKRTE